MTHAPLVVTMGEPAGIGGEVTLKAWVARHKHGPHFAVIDSPERLRSLARTFGIAAPVRAIDTLDEVAGVFAEALPVIPLPSMDGRPVTLGAPTVNTAPAVTDSITRAVELVQRGAASGIVTNPIQKATLQAGGFAFPGHTEFLGHLAQAHRAVMMLAVERPNPPLRVVPVTVHTPLRRVPTELTTDAIVECAEITASALGRDFGIVAPRLAITGLNPHAGEDGQMGDEEARIIAPAIAKLRTAGLTVTGPAPADTLFHDAARFGYDAVICMYHDQALVPLKTLDFAGGVNVTLGLPFVRTSPDHGTALDIAAKGIADATSFLAALDMAARMSAKRAR